MPPTESLPTIAQLIEQHKEVLRIKKLLIYVTENRWENDQRFLDALPSQNLIQTILLKFPNIDYLTDCLYRSVSTLSRPEAYSQIANIILAQLTPLYSNNSDVEEATQIIAAPPKNIRTQSLSEEIMGRIAQHLSNHREAIRIKKILYALIYQVWENDFQSLSRITLDGLLIQLKQSFKTYKDVQASLNQLVASLNRQTLYQQIADVIFQAIAPLYEGELSTGIMNHDAAVQAQQEGYYQSIQISSAESYKETQFIEFPPDFVQQDPKATVAFEFPPDLSLDQQLSAWDKTIRSEIPQAPATTAQTKTIIQEEPKAPVKIVDQLDIFQLRLEIMKYSNPLRVKILLFSIAYHPFDLSGQDWSMLRTCDFDTLLFEVIENYTNIVELEIKLCATAQSLFESDEHLQAAGAVIQSIKLLQK